MNWIFPKNDGGRNSGFHDAGVETFKGNFDRYLARELIQNSLDARVDEAHPVHVKFEIVKLQRSQIPGMHYLQQTFNRCAEYWNTHENARMFFERAAKLASQSRLTALKVGDYNTTGVPGTDTDRNQNWFHLIRCAGSSSKWGGEGGSFGIGKNAPFAASMLRTVFYSTRTVGDDVAFQGVSTLVSHELPNGSIAQPTGFLGGDHGESIRESGHIPPIFRREERGLDIVVLEYPAESTWQNDLVYSVLDNFWPAIEFGDLIVTVGDQTIGRDNLFQLLNDFSAQEEFTAHLFYQAYNKPTHKFNEYLSSVHECSLSITAGDMDLPKRVAMVRKTGMVIYQRGRLRSLFPFCGVFLCRNDTGNRVLRDMEPPRHDTWDPDHPERGANKKVEREYMNFIRECIKKLAPVDNSKIISIPDLNRFLPDDDEADENSFDGSDSRTTDETAERSTLPEVISGRKIDPRRHRMQPDSMSAEGEDDETEAGEGEGTGGGPANGQNETDGGTGSGGGGSGDGNAGPGTGREKGAQSKPAVPIRFRTFAKESEIGLYHLIVSREMAGNGELLLHIFTVGDDQKVPAEIGTANTSDGKDIPLVGPGIIGPIFFTEQVAQHIDIRLSEPIRVAMEVNAHEA